MSASERIWRSRHLLSGLVCALLFSTVAMAQQTEKDWKDLAYDRVTAVSADSYVVTLETSNEGYEFTRQESSSGFNETRKEWAHGPTSVSTRLVATRTPYGNAFALAEWRGQIERWRTMARGQTYDPVRDLIFDIVDVAEDLSEDAELVMRVLDGIQFYTYLPERYDEAERALPLSEVPTAFFDGAVSTVTQSNHFEPPKSDKTTLPSWSSSMEMDKGQVAELSEKQQLIVWRHDPDDMARIAELLTRLDEFRAPLTLDISGLDLDANEQESHFWTAQALHSTFRDALIRSLLDVARYAWWFGPTEAPRNIWAETEGMLDAAYKEAGVDFHPIQDEQYFDYVPFLKAAAAPNLPPIKSDTTIALVLPKDGINWRDHPHPPGSQFGLQSPPDDFTEQIVSNADRTRVDAANYNDSSVIMAAVSGDAFSGTLTNIIAEQNTRKSDDAVTTYIDDDLSTTTIRWVVKRDGELCHAPPCVPDNEDEAPDYQGPPVIGIAAASFPKEPMPDEPATLGFRVENTSDVAASAVSVQLRLVGAMAEMLGETFIPRNDFCTTTPAGQIPTAYKCDLGDLAPGAVVDLPFTARTPGNGLFIWGADLSSKGDLGGPVKRLGVLGQRPGPAILAVVPIDRQTAFEDGVPVHPYPFGPSGDGDVTRNLFVVGTNLPETRTDVTLTQSKDVRYFFSAFDDTKDPLYAPLVEKGWKTYYKMDDGPAAAARAKKEGRRGMLVDARLNQGIMPGAQKLILNGTPGAWDVQFGDITAHIAFVRWIQDEPFDLLRTAYAPGRVQVAVQTNIPLPIDEIPLTLNLSKNGVAGADKMQVVAKRAPDIGPRVYLSKPLDLHDMNGTPSLSTGTALPVALSSQKPAKISADIEADFIAAKFRLATNPATARLTVRPTPAWPKQSWLWRDALKRAAICHDKTKTVNVSTLGGEESKAIWNLIILTTSEHFPEQSVSFGQHAAAILLRDMYLDAMKRQIRNYGAIVNNPDANRGFMNKLRADVFDRTVPVLRMPVPDIAGPGTTEYRYVLMNDAEWLAQQSGKSVLEIQQYRELSNRRALVQMIINAEASMEQAEEAGDCEVEDLIRLTGFHFDAIAQLTKAEMVTLEEVVTTGGARAKLWSSDPIARFWIDRVAPVAAAVRAQEKRADIDTDLTLALLSVVAMPLMLTENAFVSFVAFGLDLLDFGVTAVHELDQYTDSADELEFAKGASLLLGDERYVEAQKEAKAWYSAALGTALSGFGAATGALDAVPKAIQLQRARRAQNLVIKIKSARMLDDLAQDEAMQFAAIAISARMRQAELGAEVLSKTESRAIELTERYAALRQATKPEDMDLPPATLAESFTPKRPIQFDAADSAPKSVAPKGFDADAPSVPNSRPAGSPDAPEANGLPPLSDAPVARMRPPPEGRISEPLFADDVPNARDARVPEGAQVVAIDENGRTLTFGLGEFVGGGATSEAFGFLGKQDELVVRITYLRPGSAAVEVDTLGDDILRNRINSDHVRAVKIQDTYDAAPGLRRSTGPGAGAPALRIAIMERVTPAYITLAEQAEALAEAIRTRPRGSTDLPIRRTTMSAAQMQAFEGAMRDLNAQGFVWLDNKPDNWGFVPLDDGSGRVQVVIFDTGGIVPVRQSIADFLGIRRAELARRIQLRANGTYETQIPEFDDIKNFEERVAVRYGTIIEDYGDALDIDGLGITLDQLWFRPSAGELFDYVAPLFEAAD